MEGGTRLTRRFKDFLDPSLLEKTSPLRLDTFQKLVSGFIHVLQFFLGISKEINSHTTEFWLVNGDLPPVVVPSFKLVWGSIGDAPFFGPI